MSVCDPSANGLFRCREVEMKICLQLLFWVSVINVYRYPTGFHLQLCMSICSQRSVHCLSKYRLQCKTINRQNGLNSPQCAQHSAISNTRVLSVSVLSWPARYISMFVNIINALPHFVFNRAYDYNSKLSRAVGCVNGLDVENGFHGSFSLHSSFCNINSILALTRLAVTINWCLYIICKTRFQYPSAFACATL